MDIVDRLRHPDPSAPFVFLVIVCCMFLFGFICAGVQAIARRIRARRARKSWQQIRPS